MAVLEVSAVIDHGHVSADLRDLQTSIDVAALSIDVVIDQPRVSLDSPPAV